MKQRGRRTTELKEGMHRGFQRGFGQVPAALIPFVRGQLIAIIGGANDCKFYYYKTGKTIIYPDVAEKIEKVFAKYGIHSHQVWDE